jgi:hypothetical protein
MVVDGNMKLDHLILKRSEEDISSSDGKLFNVRHAPYAWHLVTAPKRQPVSSHKGILNLLSNMCQEIDVQ